MKRALVSNRLVGVAAASFSMVLAGGAWAASPDAPGGLVGWVEDAGGVPVSGAVVSVFGSGLGRSGLVTLSDNAGRFVVPSLPAGSYTLRAQGAGRRPAPARRITVLPNRDLTYTLSLAPASEETETIHASAERRGRGNGAEEELVWLLRHKRRSVLEDLGYTAGLLDGDAPPQPGLLASWVSGLAGSVELVASPLTLGDEALPDSNLGVLRLRGRLAESGRWSLSGLVSEHEGAAWRMAAEFAMGPVEGHEIQVGSGYGTRLVRSVPGQQGSTRGDGRGVGALYFQDRWQASEHIATTIGGRFSYIGLIEDRNYVDPVLSLEWSRDEDLRLHMGMSRHTLVPGGDVLRLSSLATAPAVAFAVLDNGLRPERISRYEVGFDEQIGGTTVSAEAFYEDVHDQLLNSFDGPRGALSLRIANSGAMGTRGIGLTVARRFGRAVRGSMTYSYGRAWGLPTDPSALAASTEPAPDRGFHDLAARVETVLVTTDTRLAALYRVNGQTGLGGLRGSQMSWNQRFDVQLSQGLPFLGQLTRADWDVLVAVRNFYYEPSEGALLDEVLVVHPPKRVLGGIAVRF